MRDKFVLCFSGNLSTGNVSNRRIMRDMKKFQVVAELEGNLTLIPLMLDNFCGMGTCVDLLNTQTRRMLKDTQEQKILLSDIVIIFDYGDIGKDVADEKEFAVSHHKSIRYMSDICPNRTLEEFREFLTRITEV